MLLWGCGQRRVHARLSEVTLASQTGRGWPGVFEEQRGRAGAGEQGEPGDRASVEGRRGGQVVQGLVVMMRTWGLTLSEPRIPGGLWAEDERVLRY